MHWKRVVLFATMGMWLTVVSSQGEPPEKALKYLEILVKKPQPGTVFDRFVDAWLEGATLEELGTYLSVRTARPDATAGDHVVSALFQARDGEDAKALASFQEAVKLEPTNATVWLEKAKLEARMLDFSAALQSLTQAAAQNPGDVLAMQIGKLQGRTLLRTGKSEEALKTWRGLLEANPDDADLAEEVIELQLDEGLYAEAAKMYQALIEKTSDPYVKVTHRLRLADVLIRGGKKTEALEQYREALNQAGQDTWLESEALAEVNRVFRLDDNVSGMVEYLAKLAESAPQRVAVQRELARVHAELGEKDKALAIYQKLLEKTPGLREVREGYLDLLEQTEKYADAITQTKVIMEQNAGDKEWLLRLANLHRQAGDMKAAQEQLDIYLGKPGTVEFDHLRVARLLEGWQKNAEARAAYEKLVVAYPESSGAKEALAQFLHRIGEKDAAVGIWNALAAKGGQEEVLAMAQALLARLEAAAAYEVLKKRVGEFGSDVRYLAVLVTAAHAAKDDAAAVPWVLTRVQGTQDFDALDEAIRQASEILRGAGETSAIVQKLKGQSATLTIQERCLLAALLETEGDPKGAEQMLREVGQADALLAQRRLVRLLEARQDWTQAATELEKLVAMPGGRDSQNVQRLAMTKERAGDLEGSLKWIAEWKTLSPGAVTPWTQEAGVLTGLGKPKDAVQVMRAAARKFSDNDEVTGALAAACYGAGQYPEGERIYLSLYEKEEKPADKIRWVGALAQASQAQGLLDKLTVKFQERQRTNRSDASPWLALAEIYRVSENTAERLKAFQEASRLRPKDVEILHMIANVELDDGRWKEALATLNRAMPYDPTQRTRQLIATIQMRDGDDEQGFRLLTELQGGEKMDAKAVLTLADALMAKEQWRKAADFLDLHVARLKGDYRLAYLQGIALAEAGDSSGAVAVFLNVAKMTEELPEVLKKKASLEPAVAAARSLYVDRLRKWFPPGLAEISDFSQYRYNALQHKMSRNFAQRARGSGINLPDDLEQAQKYAVMQVLALREEMPEPLAGELPVKLAEAGVPYPEILMELESRGDYPWMVELPDDLLTKHPEDPLRHALWLMNGGARGQVRDIEHLKDCHRLLHAEYPYSAFTAAAMAVRADREAGLPLLKLSLDEAEKATDSAKVDYAMQLYELMGGGQMVNAASKVDLPPDLKVRCRRLLVEGGRAMGRDRGVIYQSAPYMFLFFANALIAEGAWEDFIEFWEDQCRVLQQDESKRQKQQNMANPLGIMFSGRQTAFELKPLAFPPLDSRVPGVLVVMMRHVDPFNQQRNDGSRVDYTPLKPLLGKVQDANLRLLFTSVSGDEKVFEEDMAKRLSAPDPSVDDLVWQAAYLEKKEDHARAAVALAALLEKPLEAKLRREADVALVFEASSTDFAKLDAKVQETAKLAARRLKVTQMNAADKEVLMAAYEKLGMKDEAEQWKKLAAATALTSVSGRSSSRSASYSSTQTKSRLEKAVASGDRDRAVRAMIMEMKQLNASYGQGNESYVRQEVKRHMKLLTFSDAEKLVKAALKPADGAGEQRLIEYAGFLDMLEAGEESVAVLRQVCEKNPKHKDARARLLLATARINPKEAAEVLNSISWEELAQGTGMQLLSALRGSRDISFESRMGLFEAISAFLDALAVEGKRPPRGALAWAQSLPEAVASYDNTARLPNLYAKGPPRSNYYDNKDAKVVNRRLDVFEKVCRSMMKHPSLAFDGFSGWAGIVLSKNKGLEELTPLATRLLEENATDLKSSRTSQWNAMNSYYSANESQIWRPSPAQYLIWQEWKADGGKKLEAELLPRLEKSLTAAAYQSSKAYVRLWLCPDAEYGSAVDAYSKSAIGLGGNNAVEAFVDAIDCWNSRGLSTAVMDKAMSGAAKQYAQSTLWWLSEYISQRFTRNPAGQEAFLKQVFLSILGSERDWAKKSASFVSFRWGNGGSYDPTIYAVGSLVIELMEDRAGFSSGMMASDMLGLSQISQWRENQLRQAFTLSVTNDYAWTALKDSAFLKEADKFDGIKLSSRNGSGTVLSKFVSMVRDSEPKREALSKQLAAFEPKTFGSEFCLALLAKDAEPALVNLLKSRAGDLAKVPEASREGLAELLKSTIPSLNKESTANAEVGAIVKDIMASAWKAEQSRVDQWMKASRIADLGQTDESDLESEVQTRFTDLTAKGELTAAKAFYLKACSLISEEDRKGTWDTGSGGNGWTVTSAMIRQGVRSTPNWGGMVASLQLFQEDQTGSLTMCGWSNSIGWGAAIRKEWVSAGGEMNMEKGLNHITKRLSQDLGVATTTLLGIGFYDFFEQMTQPQRLASLKWEPSPDASELERKIATEIKMGALFFLATEENSRQNEACQQAVTAAGGFPTLWKHYRAVMEDAASAPRVRLALGHHLSYRAPLAIDGEVSRIAAGLALEAQKQSHCMHGYQYSWIMNGFCRLPADEAWKAAAQAHWDAWQQRTALGKQSKNSAINYIPCDEAILAVVRMAGRADQKPWITATLAAFRDTMTNKPSMLPVLLEENRMDDAVAWFRDSWRSHQHIFTKNLLWTAKVVENRPAFLQALNDPALALLADIELATLPFPPKSERAAIPELSDKNKMLIAAAKQLPAVNIQDAAILSACLRGLGELNETYEPLASYFDKEAATVDVGAVVRSNDMRQQTLMLRPLRASVGRQAWQGNLQPALEAYDKAIKTNTDDNYYARSAVKEVGIMPIRAVVWKWGRQKEDGKVDPRCILPYLNHVLEATPNNLMDGQIREALGLKLILHHGLQEPDAVANWRKGLASDRAEQLKRHFGYDAEIWDLLKLYIWHRQPKLSASERATWVNALLKDEWLVARYENQAKTNPGPNLIQDLVSKSSFFDVAEMAEVAKSIAEALPRRGATANEAGTLLQQRGQAEAAAAMFGLAATQTPQSVNQTSVYLIRQAEVLKGLGRNDEAIKALQTLEVARLSEANKKKLAETLAALSGDKAKQGS